MDTAGNNPIQAPRKRTISRKGLSFIRPDSGSFKGAKIHKKIRKAVSLPSTPLEEGFKFCLDSNVTPSPVNGVTSEGGRVGGESSLGAEPGGQTIEESFHATQNTSSTRSGVINVGHWTSKGVSFLMDTPAVLSKSRTEKFHKLFKSVPQHEYPIDYFSCAYIGDILLQGNLYVSQNWFCFYSRIRGRGRLLEIPMDSVISITREKTALIFPNAIGLQTKKEKFAFGSFISRDNTYKFIVSVWRKSQEQKAAQAYENISDSGRSNGRNHMDTVPGTSEGLDGDKDLTDLDNVDISENLVNNNISSLSHSNNSKSESTDQSDISLCLECGSVDPSDTNDYSRSKDLNEPSILGSSSGPARSPQSCDKPQTDPRSSHLCKEKRVNHKRRKLHPGGLQFPYSVLPSIDRRKTISALRTSAVKLQRIPRTNLLLLVCTVLVLFLIVSSIGLTYKILDLEAKLETQGVWSNGHSDKFRDQTLGSLFYLQSTVKQSTAQHMQTILEANMKILGEINDNMKNLYKETKSDTKDTCSQSEDDDLC